MHVYSLIFLTNITLLISYLILNSSFLNYLSINFSIFKFSIITDNIINMNISIKDIPQLQTSNIFMKNPEDVQNKINMLIKGGFEQLQIISDFDQTLTKQKDENGLRPMTSFGLMHACPSFPPTAKKIARQLYEKYRPYELDETLQKDEKYEIMLKWWREEQDNLKNFRLPREEFEEIARHHGGALRDGVPDFLKQMYEINVPVLVFSAGLGDSIVAVLKINNVLHPNIKVISNFLNYKDDDIVDGIIEPLIHIMNKNEQAIHETEYYDLIRSRANAILMGDTIGDAGMADGVPHCNVVLKIGFVYEKADEILSTFCEYFDVVIVDDQTIGVPQAILNLIAKGN